MNFLFPFGRPNQEIETWDDQDLDFQQLEVWTQTKVCNGPCTEWWGEDSSRNKWMSTIIIAAIPPLSLLLFLRLFYVVKKTLGVVYKCLFFSFFFSESLTLRSIYFCITCFLIIFALFSQFRVFILFFLVHVVGTDVGTGGIAFPKTPERTFGRINAFRASHRPVSSHQATGRFL